MSADQETMALRVADIGPAMREEADIGRPRMKRAPLVRHRLAVAGVAAAMSVLALVSYPPGVDGLTAGFLAVVLSVVAATDLERRTIPNRVVLPAIAIVMAARIGVSPARAPEILLAALGGGLAFLLPNVVSSGSMGMGDVKLVVLLGAGLGRGVVGAIMIASLTLLPVAVAVLLRGGVAARKATLPFGPFLALGGLVVLIVPHLTSI